jgi:hypothetical protein
LNIPPENEDRKHRRNRDRKQHADSKKSEPLSSPKGNRPKKNLEERPLDAGIRHDPDVVLESAENSKSGAHFFAAVCHKKGGA